MKNPIYVNLISFCLALFFCLALNAQEAESPDSTGLPGDNFSLEAALDLFKKSTSPEDFEKKLNSQNNKVNNLDISIFVDIEVFKTIESSFFVKADLYSAWEIRISRVR